MTIAQAGRADSCLHHQIVSARSSYSVHGELHEKKCSVLGWVHYTADPLQVRNHFRGKKLCRGDSFLAYSKTTTELDVLNGIATGRERTTPYREVFRSVSGGYAQGPSCAKDVLKTRPECARVRNVLAYLNGRRCDCWPILESRRWRTRRRGAVVAMHTARRG